MCDYLICYVQMFKGLTRVLDMVQEELIKIIPVLTINS